MCREAGETGKAEMKSCIDESSTRLTGIWKLKRLAGGNVELKLSTWNYPLKVEKTNVSKLKEKQRNDEPQRHAPKQGDKHANFKL